MTNQDLFKGIMLTDALRTIVNKLFYENFDTIFIENVKSNKK